MAANIPGQLSPDGAYYWDGAQWVTTLSKDGAHRWNGSGWVPATAPATPVPPPPPAGVATVASPYGRPAARSTSSLGYQFGGVAGWSIGIGLASILVPIVTALSTGSTYYFLVLPLFGIYRGFVAVRVGRTAGGVAGIVLNVLGGLMSLVASGLILR